MSFGDYCAFPALNQSRLKDFDYELGGCPALFRYRCAHPDERRESDALATGRRYHSFLLEPGSFDKFYVTLTREIEHELFDLAKASGSKARGFSQSLSAYVEWEALQREQGREVVTTEEAQQLEAMRDAVVRDAEIMDAVGFGKTELSAFCGSGMASFGKTSSNSRPVSTSCPAEMR